MTNDESPSVADQSRYWDAWNEKSREHKLTPTSERQWQAIEALVRAEGRTDLSIIDVGCGSGWAAERLSAFGRVRATDMTENVIERARQRAPQVEFICGDFFELDLGRECYDLAVSLEVLSHVADQPRFLARLATLLKPGARLILSTQNRLVLERWEAVAAPDPAQIRHWVSVSELRNLLSPHFKEVRITSLFPVGHLGFLRFVNSPKLNSWLGRVIAPDAIERLKERALLGHTLLATARKA